MQRALSFSLSELHKHLPYSKGMPAVHMPLTMPIRTWAGEQCHGNTLIWWGYPIPQRTFGFAFSCCFCLEREITWEKLKSLFSLFQDCWCHQQGLSRPFSLIVIVILINTSIPHHFMPPKSHTLDKPLPLSVPGNKILTAQVCTNSLQVTWSQACISV